MLKIKSMLINILLLSLFFLLSFIILNNNFKINNNIVLVTNFFIALFFILNLILCKYFYKNQFFYLNLMLLYFYILEILFYKNKIEIKTIDLYFNFFILAFFSLILIKEKALNLLFGKLFYIILALELVMIYLIQNFTKTNKIFKSLLLNFSIFEIVFIFLAIIIILYKNYKKQSLNHIITVNVLLTIIVNRKIIVSNNQYLLWFLFLTIFTFISILIITYKMAYLDELTKIPGRRALNESIEKLGRKYTVAMVDIDFFKKFNDKYGHAVGDDVLKLVASKIKKVSGGGKGYRYGGEEFTIIFKNKESSEVINKLEELRKSIEEKDFIVRSNDRKTKSKKDRGKIKKAILKKAKLTISIGVAEKKDKTEKIEDIIKKADKGLYKAKNNGRNQVSYIK